MIEQGLVALVRADSTVSALTPNGGGYPAVLPKDPPMPTWRYQRVTTTPNPGLQTVKGLVESRWQIDCYGNTQADVLALARAIDNVLNGFAGNLADADQTFVSSSHRIDESDGPFLESARQYRHMLEYDIWFAQV